MMNFLNKYAGIMALVAIVIAIAAFTPVNQKSTALLSGTASTMGNTPIPQVITGGSQPSVVNALEATESFLSDGLTYLMGTTTYLGGSNVNASPVGAGTVYENKGGRQYAYTSISLSSTSSIPVILNNPFGTTASTSVDAINCNITNPSGSFTVDISTTTLANSTSGANGSSTPAFVFAKTIPANAVTFPISWRPFLLASTTALTISGSLFTAPGPGFDGSMPFNLKGTEVVTMKVATGTPGTYVTYPSGTCDVQFSK